MAVLSEMEEEVEGRESSPPPEVPGSSDSSVSGPYDAVLKPILESQAPLSFLESTIDFLRRESDLFEEEGVEKEISAIVSIAREKHAEEKERVKKKRAEEKGFDDGGKAEKRMKDSGFNSMNADSLGKEEGLKEINEEKVEEPGGKVHNWMSMDTDLFHGPNNVGEGHCCVFQHSLA